MGAGGRPQHRSPAVLGLPEPSAGLSCEGAGTCRPLCVTACLDLQWQSNYFSPFSDKQPLGGVCEYVHAVPYKHVHATGFGGLLTIIGNGDKGPAAMSLLCLLGKFKSLLIRCREKQQEIVQMQRENELGSSDTSPILLPVPPTPSPVDTSSPLLPGRMRSGDGYTSPTANPPLQSVWRSADSLFPMKMKQPGISACSTGLRRAGDPGITNLNC